MYRWNLVCTHVFMIVEVFVYVFVLLRCIVNAKCVFDVEGECCV